MVGSAHLGWPLVLRLPFPSAITPSESRCRCMLGRHCDFSGRVRPDIGKPTAKRTVANRRAPSPRSLGRERSCSSTRVATAVQEKYSRIANCFDSSTRITARITACCNRFDQRRERGQREWLSITLARLVGRDRALVLHCGQAIVGGPPRERAPPPAQRGRGP